MDETIGSKGGYNDRRRSLVISSNQKKKLRAIQKEKELKELEADVKKKQIYTMIKSLPIAVAGGTFKILYDTATGKKDIDKQEEYSKWRIKEYDTDFSTRERGEKPVKTKVVVVIEPDGHKVTIRVPIIEDDKIVEIPLHEKDVIISPKYKEDKKDDIKVVAKQEEKKQEEKKQEIKVETKKEETINVNVEKKQEEINNKKQKEGKFSFGVAEDIQPEKNTKEELKEINKSNFVSDIFIGLSEKEKEKLSKLQARKIIDEYEKQLKDIRYELRLLVFDYNILVDEGDKAIKSEELDSILERLNELIIKIESLKDKIQIDNLDKYDDNYIYTLIEDYLVEFKDKRVVNEIKDSPLYIMISEKLDEIDRKKDTFKEDLEEKREEKKLQEEDFEKLREKYYKVDKINKDLLNFQNEQDALLKDIQEKVRNAVTVSERVQVEVQAMNISTRRLLRMLRRSLLFPVPRAGRAAAAQTALYLSFMRQILNPPTTTRRYRVITVEDYSRDIEYSIKSLENALDLLSKTSKQVDKFILQIKDEFKDYLGVLPECDELLHNLEKVKSDLREKEYEMEKIKKEQEKELEKNNAKVLTRGEYPM